MSNAGRVSVPRPAREPARGRWRIPLARPSVPPLQRFSDALESVWASRILSNRGPQAAAFELAYARYRGGRGHAICTSSADLALTLSLRALELPRGTRALLPSLAYPSTIHAVEWNNLEPYFVDVDAMDWCVHPEQIERELGNVSVVLATHLFGVPCDVQGLTDLTRSCGAALVFDAAHAVASWVGDRHVTDFGDASVVSFSGTKMITGAEAGIVTVNDAGVAERMRHLCAYGLDDQRASTAVGLNAKLSELNATLALLNLNEIENQVAVRRGLIETYRSHLEGVGGVGFQGVPPGVSTTPTFFVVTIRNHARDRVRAALADRGIESRPYFPPLHLMSRLRNASRQPLPVTEELGETLLALPLYSELGAEAIEEICSVVASQLRVTEPVSPTSGG